MDTIIYNGKELDTAALREDFEMQLYDVSVAYAKELARDPDFRPNGIDKVS